MMKKTTSTWRALALGAQALVLVACGGSNQPSTMNVTTTGSAGTGAPTGAAGATTGAGPSSGAAGAGGATGAAGTTGAAGAPATPGGGGASGAGAFSPNCAVVPLTAAGAAPAKAGVCVAADTQLCYKACGPQSVGFKSETCTNGAYVEQSGCTFPPGMDYACYKIPAAIDASCPATPPQASQACTVAPCTPCNAGGSYLDSTGMTKPGYCVCPAAGMSGSRKWSCASATAWPCPSGQGC